MHTFGLLKLSRLHCQEWFSLSCPRPARCLGVISIFHKFIKFLFNHSDLRCWKSQNKFCVGTRRCMSKMDLFAFVNICMVLHLLSCVCVVFWKLFALHWYHGLKKESQLTDIEMTNNFEWVTPSYSFKVICHPNTSEWRWVWPSPPGWDVCRSPSGIPAGATAV